MRGDESSTYMFSVNGQTTAQAKIRNDSIRKLKSLPDELAHFLDTKRDDSRELSADSHNAISSLRYGCSGVSLKARVVKKSEVRAVNSKDGTPLLVCDITLSDGTGEIPLAVWNSQISTVSKGDLVQVQNARVRSFRGEIQLSLGRKNSVLTVLEPADKERRAAA
jgi:ssDNA-binding replication factor A large subunit